MATTPQVNVYIRQIAKYGFECHCVMKGKFYQRTYLECNKKEALKRFSEYLGEQLAN